MKRKYLFNIIVLVNILISTFNIFILNVSASWMAESTEILSSSLTGIDPSVNIEPSSKKMHYSFTLKSPVRSDIAYMHNLDGVTAMRYMYDDFTNPDKTLPNNYTYCGHSDIFVYNDTVHIVFEAILKGQSVYNIFYTNNSGPSFNFSQNIVNVTGSATFDSRYPSIVGINDTIWIAYQRETASDREIYIKTNNNSNYYNEAGIEFLIDPVAGAVDNSHPKLHLFKDENNYRIDLVFMRDGNLYGCNTSYGHMPDLNSLAFTIDDTGPIVDFDYDANAELISLGYVGWDTDGEIYARNVTSGGLSAADRFTTNAVNDGNPDVVIDNSNNTHIYYTRNNTATSAKLYVRDNHITPFNTEEELIGVDEIPNTDIENNEILIYNFDVDIADDAIFIIYVANYDILGGGWNQPHLYTFGYHLFYNYGEDDYHTYSYYEPAVGEYIVEALVLNYDLSGPDWNVTFKFTDLISNATWENNTILPAAGGEQQRIRFYSPDNYFITKNNYSFEILNGSNGNGLLKMDFDPTAIEAYQTYNLTSPSFPNGTHFNYTLFEDFLYFFIEFEFKPINPFTSTPCYAGGYIDGEIDLKGGGFDPTNYADLFKFSMVEGDQYNFSYWDNSSDTRLYFFNDSVQITNESNSIIFFSGDHSQEQHITFICNKSGNYFVFIENIKYNGFSKYFLNYSLTRKLPYFINQTKNFSIFEGDMFKKIVWTPIDDFEKYNSFWVLKNGTNIFNGTWDGSQIVYSDLYKYSPQVYNFTCFVNNTNGYENCSTVLVTVELNDIPRIANNTNNFTQRNYYSQFSLSWHAIDVNGNNHSYWIVQNDTTIVAQGFWENKTDINYQETEVLDSNYYNYTCFVNDTSGAVNWSSIIVLILPNNIPQISKIGGDIWADSVYGFTYKWHAIDVDGNNRSYWITRNETLLQSGFWNNDSDIIFTDYEQIPVGHYNYTCFVNDSTGVVNQSSIYLNLTDNTNPSIYFVFMDFFYLNTTSPQYYHEGVEIACIIGDYSDISWVKIYENSTGAFKNTLMTYSHGDTWIYVIDLTNLRWGDYFLFSFSAEDEFGNIGYNDNSSSYFKMKIRDFVDPQVSLSFTPYNGSNVVNESTIFTLTASDGGGSGIAAIYYKINITDWTLYTGPFNLSLYYPGHYIIYYYAIDADGRSTDVQSIVIELIEVGGGLIFGPVEIIIIGSCVGGVAVAGVAIVMLRKRMSKVKKV